MSSLRERVEGLIAKWRETAVSGTRAETAFALDKCARELAAALAAEGPPIETGWLIERRTDGPEWLEAWSGGYEWTKDSLKAIRFCRRQDANQIAEIFDGEDVHITEHQWS